jgi:hypothetical protein
MPTTMDHPDAELSPEAKFESSMARFHRHFKGFTWYNRL